MACQPTTPSSQVPHEGVLRHLPVSLFASVMGVAGLALAWRAARHGLGAPAWVGEALGALAWAVFLLLSSGYLAKLARHPEAVKAEFHHPVAGNFFGTVAISILLLSSVTEPYSAAAASVLWSAGAVATLALSFVIVSRLLQGRVHASHALPVWLIAVVATLDIPVTGGHMPMAWAPELNLFAAAVGSVMALVLFTMIVSRLVHGEALAPALSPSLMILVAPFAVGFLAYTNVVGGVDRFAGLLFHFGLFMFVAVSPRIFRRGVGFSATWWAIGFPVAALVNAALRYAEFRASPPLWGLAAGLLGLLSVALPVLAVRTVRVVLDGKPLT